MLWLLVTEDWADVFVQLLVDDELLLSDFFLDLIDLWLVLLHLLQAWKLFGLWLSLIFGPLRLLNYLSMFFFLGFFSFRVFRLLFMEVNLIVLIRVIFLILIFFIHTGHVNLTTFRFCCAHAVTNSLDLIVKFSHFSEVTDFVKISLVLKVFSLGICHILPTVTNMLHHNESSHVWVFLYNFRSRLNRKRKLGDKRHTYFFDEDHVG